jgi:adenine-specific DNA-methyltransferase
MKIYSKIPKDFTFKNYFKNNDAFLWNGEASKILSNSTEEPFIDLLVTSPPYNIGKSYEEKKPLDSYFEDQRDFLRQIDPFIKEGASICYQVGNYIPKGVGVYPLDYGFHKIFEELGYSLINRIVWTFGHGFHAKKRLSGRHEIILWYSKGEEYTFNLDGMRRPSKYPGKTYYKGPKKGQVSSNILGKNASDVWDDIPHVVGNHIEKTEHPCQFPIALPLRLIQGLTNENDVVFDPYMGVGSAGAAAILKNRKFIGADTDKNYVRISKERLLAAKDGTIKYRPLEKPIFDHNESSLSKHPNQNE